MGIHTARAVSVPSAARVRSQDQHRLRGTTENDHGQTDEHKAHKHQNRLDPVWEIRVFWCV
jgi:hypothetical protein